MIGVGPTVFQSQKDGECFLNLFNWQFASVGEWSDYVCTMGKWLTNEYRVLCNFNFTRFLPFFGFQSCNDDRTRRQ